MNEPVITDSLVLRYEDDSSASLTSFTPGPAGEVAIEASPGIEVSFDAANPAQVARITVERGADMEVLAELIGESRAARVQFDTMVPVTGAARLPRVGPRRRELPSRRELSEPTPLALTAVSLSQGRDLRRSSLARAVALLEVLEARREGVPGLRTVEAQLQQLAEEAEDLVSDVPQELQRLLDRDPEAAGRVADLFERAGGRAPMLRVIASALRTRLGRVESAPVRSSKRSSSKLEARARLLPNGRLRVRGIGVETRWVRVIRRQPLTLLAAAPFVAGPKGLQADLVIPPDLTLDDLEISLVKDPMPLQGTDPFSRIRKAVMFGRRAVELHHAGRYDRSRELWVDCSAAWTEVGDTTRANMARAYAEQGYFSHRPSTLSERVQAVVRVPTSGRRILSRSPR